MLEPTQSWVSSSASSIHSPRCTDLTWRKQFQLVKLLSGKICLVNSLRYSIKINKVKFLRISLRNSGRFAQFLLLSLSAPLWLKLSLIKHIEYFGIYARKFSSCKNCAVGREAPPPCVELVPNWTVCLALNQGRQDGRGLNYNFFVWQRQQQVGNKMKPGEL